MKTTLLPLLPYIIGSALFFSLLLNFALFIAWKDLQHRLATRSMSPLGPLWHRKDTDHT